jgi:hypothetical protein
MEFFWKFESIPELAPLSKAQRSEVWAATIGKRLRVKDVIVAVLILLLFMAVGGFLGGHFIPIRFGTTIGCMVCFVPGYVVSWGYLIPRARPAIAAEVDLRRARGIIE